MPASTRLASSGKFEAAHTHCPRATFSTAAAVQVVAAPCAASLGEEAAFSPGQVCCHFIPALDRCGSDRVQYTTEMVEHVRRNVALAARFVPVKVEAQVTSPVLTTLALPCSMCDVGALE